ncbi:glycosyltransferase family 1 protein [Chitinispirillales bacterium ANBcel5]|uniref:glycosyltransferase family 4 protein n=1 Tax=Cellulosispirillum alkaliphilum TaxID=3039283 RepID=UPI002A5131C5|nr:glycosyltransferase family 1 protein [Chitinispirillales bacterium ANBcel5]
MKKTTVAIDCRPLENEYAGHGIGTVVRNILSSLQKTQFATNIELFATTNNKNIPHFSCKRLWRPSWREWVWEQLFLPFDIALSRCSVYHSTVSLGPIRSVALPFLSTAKTIATVYDLNSFKCEALKHTSKTRSFKIQTLALKKAAAIVTFSQYVKKHITESFSIVPEMIVVLPVAVDKRIAEVYEKAHYECHCDGHYIFSMGETANKNIETVITVFETLVSNGYRGNLRIAGLLSLQPDSVKDRYKKSFCKEKIHFLGRISVNQLVGEYAHCDFFIYPSICEGFGLPVIEAMYCAAPVLCSSVTSLPEAGGEAALYCDPFDVDTFVTNASLVTADKKFRNRLIDEGRRHASANSWDDTAEKLITLYKKLL